MDIFVSPYYGLLEASTFLNNSNEFYVFDNAFFIGIIGEYIGAIYTKCMNRPLVHEQERVNF
ncbi:MAG: hypothetical protein ACO201_04925 [Rickettsiales bacterium]